MVDGQSDPDLLLPELIFTGFSVPMTITPSDSSCTTASCGEQTDILTQCDPRLVLPAGSKAICLYP